MNESKCLEQEMLGHCNRGPEVLPGLKVRAAAGIREGCDRIEDELIGP